MPEPFNYNKVKLEEIKTEFEEGVPQEEAKIDFEAELEALKIRAEVAEAKVEEAEVAAVKATETREAKKIKQAAAKKQRTIATDLRKTDPPGRKTCAVCLTRVALPQIGYGNHDVCDTCK